MSPMVGVQRKLWSKYSLMSFPSASHSGESCQFLNNKSPSALCQTSVSLTMSWLPVMGKETVPVIPVMAKEATPVCPATVQEAKSLEISQLTAPPILTRETVPQISASKAISSEYMVNATLPKTAATIHPLHPPVAAVNPLPFIPVPLGLVMSVFLCVAHGFSLIGLAMCSFW